MSSNPHRLHRAVHPERYDIVLEPDLAAATFRGTVDIALVVDEPVEELVCNAADLVLEQATLEIQSASIPLTWSHDDRVPEGRLRAAPTVASGRRARGCRSASPEP